MALKSNEIQLSHDASKMNVGVALALHEKLTQFAPSHPAHLRLLFELAWDKEVPDNSEMKQFVAELSAPEFGFIGDDGELPVAIKQVIRAAVRVQPGGELEVVMPFKPTDSESQRKWHAKQSEWSQKLTKPYLQKFLDGSSGKEGPGPGGR